MERLNYEVLQKSGYDGYVLKQAPEKVLQFEKTCRLKRILKTQRDKAEYL